MNVLFRMVAVVVWLAVVAGCAVPATFRVPIRSGEAGKGVDSHQYVESCIEAEQDGRLEAAEEACQQAAAATGLNDSLKSQRLYNLARIKRRLGKDDQAAELFRQSLKIEQQQPQPSQKKIGRRLAGLAIVYGKLDRFDDGLPYVQQLIPLADVYPEREKRTLAGIFYFYSQELQEKAPPAVLKQLKRKSLEMGFGASGGVE